MPDEHDEARDEPEENRQASRRPFVPAIGQVEETGEQKERIHVAVGTVVGRVVKEVRAEEDGEKRGRCHGVTEVPAQDVAKHHETRDCPEHARETRCVLIVKRKSVRRQVGPSRQEVSRHEKGRLKDGDANRMCVDPSSRLRPADDCGEGWKLAAAAVQRDLSQRGVVKQKPGRQVDVVAEPVRSNRLIGLPRRVDEHVASHAKGGCERDDRLGHSSRPHSTSFRPVPLRVAPRKSLP